MARSPGEHARFRAWMAVGLWAAVILFISSLPELPQKGPEIPYLDKVGHACEYAILGFLLRKAFIRQGGSLAILPGVKAAAIAVVYGGLDELHQLVIPHREACVGDFLADSVGALLAQFSSWLRNVYVHRKACCGLT